MLKLLSSAIITAGLMFINVPEAAAHTEARSTHVVPAYAVDHRRDRHSRDFYQRNSYDRDFFTHKRGYRMPKWLTRQKSFWRWYNKTPLRRYRFLTWDQLYDIYLWERSYFLKHRH